MHVDRSIYMAGALRREVTRPRSRRLELAALVAGLYALSVWFGAMI